MTYKAGERRKVGRTSLETQLLGLGTVPLGGWPHALTNSEAFDILEAAWAAGVRTFDTAPLYGCGLAEERLGAFLRDKPRDEVIVISKVGRLVIADNDSKHVSEGNWNFDFSYDGTMRSVEASLTRLGLDRLDIILIHDPDDHLLQAKTETFFALDELRSGGSVTAIGAGMNQNPALHDLVADLDLDVILLAGRYTVLDHSALNELFPLCAKRSTSVLIGGVFNSGVLNNPAPGTHFDYLPLNEHWRSTALMRGARKPKEFETAEYWLTKAQAINAICCRYRVPIQAAALQFAAAHPLVCSIVVGVGRPHRFAQNIDAMAISIPPQLWSDLKTEGLMDGDAPTPKCE